MNRLIGAALACGIAPFEQDHHALAGFLHPALYLQQLDLQRMLGLLVVLATHAGAVRVAGGQAGRGAVFVAALGGGGDFQCSRLLADAGDRRLRLALAWAARAGWGDGGLGWGRGARRGGFFGSWRSLRVESDVRLRL
ncbi:hypothetical protein PPS11_10423 [Pseudomonas putida S11]|nr:hypothetical protein PPS11_10423 [Pseudomonas putida S11]